MSKLDFRLGGSEKNHDKCSEGTCVIGLPEEPATIHFTREERRMLCEAIGAMIESRRATGALAGAIGLRVELSQGIRLAEDLRTLARLAIKAGDACLPLELVDQCHAELVAYLRQAYGKSGDA